MFRDRIVLRDTIMFNDMVRVRYVGRLKHYCILFKKYRFNYYNISISI